MAPSLGKLIADRAKRDPTFKRQTLTALRTSLAKTKPRTEQWQRINRAIVALDNLK
jgi:hypothetical protein